MTHCIALASHKTDASCGCIRHYCGSGDGTSASNPSISSFHEEEQQKSLNHGAARRRALVLCFGRSRQTQSLYAQARRLLLCSKGFSVAPQQSDVALVQVGATCPPLLSLSKTEALAPQQSVVVRKKGALSLVIWNILTLIFVHKPWRSWRIGVCISLHKHCP